MVDNLAHNIGYRYGTSERDEVSTVIRQLFETAKVYGSIHPPAHLDRIQRILWEQTRDRAIGKGFITVSGGQLALTRAGASRLSAMRARKLAKAEFA
jgi:hypothetical protein